MSDLSDFKDAFPELASVGDPQILACLATSDIWMDASMWAARDFQAARRLFAAHLLMLIKQQSPVSTSISSSGAGATGLFVSSISIGERTVSFQQRSMAAAASSKASVSEMMFQMTMYGQLFLQLRRRNILPSMIV